jgi:hypothetical protein
MTQYERKPIYSGTGGSGHLGPRVHSLYEADATGLDPVAVATVLPRLRRYLVSPPDVWIKTDYFIFQERHLI